jgi:hypothetical protein
MKRYMIHPIGEEPKVIQADQFVIDGEPREIRFFRGSELIEDFYLHYLRKPVRELPAEEKLGDDDQVLEPSVHADW